MSTDYQKTIRESRETFNKTSLALRKIHPKAWNELAGDQEAKPQHPADMRRDANKCPRYYNEILHKAQGRDLSDDEFKALQCLQAIADQLHALADEQKDLEENYHPIDGSWQAARKQKIFGRGERTASESRPENLQGVSLGGIMAAMAGLTDRRTPGIQNAISEGTDSLGGYTVPTQLLLEFVDLLRSKTVLFEAGAKTVFLETNKTNLATVITDPVPGWRAENAPVSESDLGLGNVQFTPKSLMVIVRLSRELLMDSLNIQNMLVNSLAQALALQIDYAGLYGSGASNQPLGLDSRLTTAGRVTTLAANGAKLSASGNYKPILQAAAQIALANDDATTAIMSPRTLYDINILTDSTGQPLQQPKELTDMTMYDTTSVPTNLTVGTASGVCSELFVGNFENLYFGLREGLNIRVLNETYAGNGQIGFEASMRADWQVARINSFWKVRGILAE